MAVNTKGGGPVLGLDIGSAYIKAVEMRPAKGGLAITGIGVTPTPPGTIVGDEIVDPATLAAAVKQCLSEAGIRTKSVVSSVSGQNSVIVRVIDVPRMNQKELAETMRWEISRHVPFAPEEVVQDFAPVVRPGDDPMAPNMSVLLAVAQNTVVNGHLETLLRAGLAPVAIEVESLSSSRLLLDMEDLPTDEAIAVVNMGASKTDVGIFEKGALAFPRIIPVAGEALTDAVARALGVEMADAERLKKEFGEVPADATKRFGSAAPAAEEFSFGDFGAAGGFISEGDAAIFGAQGASGVVGGSVPAEGPSFEVPAIGGPLGVPEPVPPLEPSPFGGPAFAEAAPGIPPIGDPTLGAAAFAPDFGGTVAVPVEPPAFGAPEPPVESFAFSVPAEPPSDAFAFSPSAGPAPLLPVEAPFIPEPVPAPIDVLTEAERHRRGISDAFMPVLAELVSEIGRSMEYYVSRANGTPVKRVIVCGGTSRLNGLQHFMEAELGVPVVRAGIPAPIGLSSKQVTAEYLAEVAGILPVAEGLASYDFVVPATPAMPVKKGRRK